MSWLIGPGVALALMAAAALHPAARRRLRALGAKAKLAFRAIGRWHGRRGSVNRADLLANTFGIWTDPITVGRAYERLDVGHMLVEGTDPVAVLATRFSCSEERIVSLLGEYLATPSVR